MGSSGPVKCSGTCTFLVVWLIPQQGHAEHPARKVTPNKCPTATGPLQCSLSRGEPILHLYPLKGTYIVESKHVAACPGQESRSLESPMLTWQEDLTNHPDVKRPCYRQSTYAQRIVTPPKGWEGGIKIELKRGSLEPKWHWSVRYCCNFLCAKHGYKQITIHPITSDFFDTDNQEFSQHVNSC